MRCGSHPERPGWRTRATRGAVAALLGPALALALSGCAGMGDVRFTVDRRITITEPGNLDEVTMPTTVRWRVNDPSVVGEGTRFAVLIDAETIPKPRGSLRDIDPAACQGSEDPECPGTEVLASVYHVYLTTDTSVTVPSVPNAGGVIAGANTHTVQIILIDSGGRRVGDAYWRASFKVRG